jgi:hypothetical protein
MLLNGDKVFIPKLDAGREALRQVRAYLDDPNRVYPTGKDIDPLPRVFNHAWKVIILKQLPINFRKDYMKMVSEYLYMVPHKPRYPQDGSGRVPVDVNARSELAPRQKDPYWVGKTLDLVFNPWVDNSLPRRDEGGLQLSLETNEDSKDNKENKDDGGWFADLDIDWNQNLKDDGAKQNSFEFDLSAEWKRGLPAEDEDSQYPVSQKNDTKEMSFEEALDAAMAAVAHDAAMEIALDAAVESLALDEALLVRSCAQGGVMVLKRGERYLLCVQERLQEDLLRGYAIYVDSRIMVRKQAERHLRSPTNGTKDIFSEKALHAVTTMCLWKLHCTSASRVSNTRNEACKRVL